MPPKNINKGKSDERELRRLRRNEKKYMEDVQIKKEHSIKQEDLSSEDTDVSDEHYDESEPEPLDDIPMTDAQQLVDLVEHIVRTSPEYRSEDNEYERTQMEMLRQELTKVVTENTLVTDLVDQETHMMKDWLPIWSSRKKIILSPSIAWALMDFQVSIDNELKSLNFNDSSDEEKKILRDRKYQLQEYLNKIMYLFKNTEFSEYNHNYNIHA